METERRLVEVARRLAEARIAASELALQHALEAHSTLSAEQEAMVRHVCQPGRAVEVVVGWAAARRTCWNLLQRLKVGFESSTGRIVAVAFVVRNSCYGRESHSRGTLPLTSGHQIAPMRCLS